MKLYDGKMQPSARRLRMFLAEKGVSVPTVPIDLGTAENRTPKFLALNPVGELPTLELDDGTVLTESIALCRYFEALHPEPNLLGRGALETAQIEMWALRLMFRLYVPMTQAFQHTHKWWADRIQQVPEYGAISRQKVLDQLAQLETHMAGREFVAAPRFTLADIVAFTTIEFGKPVGIRLDPATLPNLARWREAVLTRPSAAA